MPRDLFGAVTGPSITLGTRKWYSVPLSFLVHTFALGVLVVVPLVATGALPSPATGALVVQLSAPPLPQPPPAPRPAPATPAATTRASAAPVITPENITPEPAFDPGFEEGTPAAGSVVGGSVLEGSSAIEPPPPVVKPVVPPARVRVGGVVRQPERVTHVAPVYPAIALAARVEGLVILEATISTDGRVQEARVLRSESPLLNDAALAAVRQWTYTPTLLNGVPVSVIMTVTVHFQMR